MVALGAIKAGSAVLRSFRTAFRSARQTANEQAAERRAWRRGGDGFRYQHHSSSTSPFQSTSGASSGGFGAGSAGQRARGTRPGSLLDFSPRIKFKKTCSPSWVNEKHQRCGPCLDPAEPCPNAFMETIRLFLLEAHMTNGRRHPHKCNEHKRSCARARGPAQGRRCRQWHARMGYVAQRQRDFHRRHHQRTYRGKANSGGAPEHCSFREAFGALKFVGKCGHYERMSLNISGPLVNSGNARQYQHYSPATRTFPFPFQPSLQHQSVSNDTGLHAESRSNNRSPSHWPQASPFASPALGRIVIPQLSPNSLTHRCPEFNMGVLRLFHSSSRSSALPAIFAKVTRANFLKNSETLSYVNLLFRISVSFIPLSWRRAVLARKARMASLAAGTVISEPVRQTIFRIVCRSALLLPFALLAAVLLASLEITPISGRLRLLLISEAEEKDIVNKVLEVGTTTQPLAVSRESPMIAHYAEGDRDWLTIMRAVLGEEDAPSGTLLGGKVLDPASDWRARLVEDVLRKLESAVPSLTDPTQSGQQSRTLIPPRVRHPLSKSSRSHCLSRNNAVLVIERPESNAFSFGFYGSVDRPQPGVIIVFTGAIDEILRGSLPGSDDAHKAAHTSPSTVVEQTQAFYSRQRDEQYAQWRDEPTWLSSFFASILPSKHHLHQQQDDRRTVMPTGGHIVSKEEEQALAVLLAHELAHLVLSHTIESYAHTALLWPQLEKLGWDILRVFIYPITALLGPFVQDAISATVKAGYEESTGLLPAITSSCESRKMETEADLVALRLLSNAGIDPRCALEFWESRTECASTQEHGHSIGHHHSHGNDTQNAHVQAHAPPSDKQEQKSSFVRTHPADRDRIEAIRRELQRWKVAA